MTRHALFFAFLATPLSAWEFTPNPVCTLEHDAADASVRVTYDPRAAEPYAITISKRAGSWPAAPIFAIDFIGPRGFTISTDRHVLSGDGTSLTVSDRGFGNVLNGLALNETATARLGDATLSVSLEGAAAPVDAFRACTAAPIA